MDEAIVNKSELKEFQELAPDALHPSPNVFRICITDLIMECSYIGSEQDSIDALVIQIFGAADQDDFSLLHLEEIDQNKHSWKYNGKIERTISTEGITLVAQSGRGHLLGYIQLMSQNLGNFTTQAKPNDNIICTLEPGDMAVVLQLSFHVSTIPVKEDIIDKGGPEIGSSFAPNENKNGLVIHYANDEKDKSMISAQSVNIKLNEHPDQGQEKVHMAQKLLESFDHTSSLTEISKAILIYQDAINIAPEGHIHMHVWLGKLGLAYSRRYEKTGDHTDISQAISLLQKALRLTPEEHTNCMHNVHGGLVHAFQKQFEHTGDLASISQATSLLKKVIHLTPEGDPDMCGQLASLAAVHRTSFECRGDLTDISEAISLYQKAIFLTHGQHANMAALLGDLAIGFLRKFQHTRDLIDISEAIATFQKAIDLTSERHAVMPLLLGHLAVAFCQKFEHTNDLTDNSKAISLYQRSIDLAPEGHANMHAWLGNLATAFVRHYSHTGDITYISKAISLFQKAIHLIPKGHANMRVWLVNLAVAFKIRFHDCFEHTKDLTDISEAISLYNQALNVTPEGHAGMPDLLSNLAGAYFCHFHHVKDVSILQKAVACWHHAALLPTGSPLPRLKAAIDWATYCPISHCLHLTLKAYDTVAQLLPQVAGLENTIQRQYSNLADADVSGISMQAASYACSISDPQKAIEWLEQGRCLVWRQLNNLRSPLDELHDCHPDLADKLMKTSHELELTASRPEHSISNSMVQQMSQQQEAHNHIHLAKARDELLEEIREIPQFKHFLQPQPCSELLKHLPKSGPVVVINVYKARCDALALLYGLDVPLHIPLPDFSVEKAESLYQCLTMCMGNNRGDQVDVMDERKFFVHPPGAKPSIQYILGELWNLVVKPILNGLGYSSPPAQLSRIWWCATGPLALLPIHAAGIYSTSPTETTEFACTLSDFAISSYTPTVTALTEQVKNSHQIQIQKKGLLMISQPNTPGCSPIPGTTTEVRAIEEQLKPYNIQVSSLEGSDATVEQVINNMDTYSCVHFACHATQHPNKPLESAFFLHDGKLKLSTIIKNNLHQAELAFLSACQTSVGDKKLQDEAVHLAAGMLAAGYKGVVATMWSIKDAHAPQIAEDFYAQLISNAKEVGCKDIDGTNAAFAIHQAIQKIRCSIGDNEQSLSVWVPYVHFGL